MDKYEGPAEIYVNGRLQAQAAKFTATVKGNDNPVNTMQQGFAGFSDGPTSSEASIESAIPRKGYEVNFVAHVVAKKFVTIVCKSGGCRHQFVGRFTDTTWSNATDATTMITGNFLGGPPKTLGG